jgi:hypothetical protein
MPSISTPTPISYKHANQRRTFDEEGIPAAPRRANFRHEDEEESDDEEIVRRVKLEDVFP